MEKKLRQLFDYQKFANNEELSDAIDMCDESSDKGKQKCGILSCYRRSFLTMAGSTVAAALFLVFNLIFTDMGGALGMPAMTGSLFSDGNIGYISAAVIFVLGITVSFILFSQDRKKVKNKNYIKRGKKK